MMSVAAWFALLFGAFCLGGCARAPAAAPSPTRGYILISLDTLGSRHLSGYGYGRETSPFLDRLGERGIVFENAVVQYTSTLVSHTSMFTGLYPQEHGVYPPFSGLSAQIETLPESFRNQGFSTAAFTEGGFLVQEAGFGRGFDRFEAGSAGELGAPGRHTIELATAACDVPMWLGRGEDTRCLSVKVEGAELSRAELYDLAVRGRSPVGR